MSQHFIYLGRNKLAIKLTINLKVMLIVTIQLRKLTWVLILKLKMNSNFLMVVMSSSLVCKAKLFTLQNLFIGRRYLHQIQLTFSLMDGIGI